MSNHTILISNNSIVNDLTSVIECWAQQSTDSTSLRRSDLLRDKCRSVETFFTWSGKSVENITPADVRDWQSVLERRGYSANSVYGMISKISSLYNWLLQDETITGKLHGNPCRLVRPKAPKAYQSESTKSLDDDELRALIQTIKTKADSGDLAAKRDLAIVYMFMATGARRAEILGLKWGNLKFNGLTVLTARRKGGEIISQEIKAQEVKDYLFGYLNASGKMETIHAHDPLWLRHDRAAKPGQALSSHGFALSLKQHAIEAGIGDINIHRFRHSFARLIGDLSGSLVEVQESLGHKNLNTTRVYCQKIGVKRDRYSADVLKRLEFQT